MKRFTTFAQRRILRYYWDHHAPFSVSDLIEKKVLHIPALNKLTLRLMESRGQIIKHGKRHGEFQYIATTESKEEWKRVFGISTYGMNEFEKEHLIESLEEIIETYRQSDDGAETETL